jgi:hypothetical protein
MIFIKSKKYPFKGYRAVTHWPFVFYRKMDDSTRIHETIHGRQQVELLIIGFYLVYLVEWIFKGYKNISFEKEAYKYERDSEYLSKRKAFAQWRYKT